MGQSLHYLQDQDHYSTAYDLSLLAKAIINEFPDYYKWYSTKEFTYNNITQKNRNALLWRDPSVDGIKTGSTNEAGYCLISSAERNGMRLISVVMGTATPKARINGSQAMLNYGFRFFETKKVFAAAEEIIKTKTWKTESESLSLGLSNELKLIIQKDFEPDLTILLDASIEVITSRRKLNPNDRFESENIEFFERVRNGYLELADIFNERIIVIDDINDTGTTLQGIHDVVEKAGAADNVKYVTLLEKMSSDFSTQICAKEIEEEDKRWIVFPYEEWWK